MSKRKKKPKLHSTNNKLNNHKMQTYITKNNDNLKLKTYLQLRFIKFYN